MLQRSSLLPCANMIPSMEPPSSSSFSISTADNQHMPPPADFASHIPADGDIHLDRLLGGAKFQGFAESIDGQDTFPCQLLRDVTFAPHLTKGQLPPPASATSAFPKGSFSPLIELEELDFLSDFPLSTEATNQQEVERLYRSHAFQEGQATPFPSRVPSPVPFESYQHEDFALFGLANELKSTSQEASAQPREFDDMKCWEQLSFPGLDLEDTKENTLSAAGCSLIGSTDAFSLDALMAGSPSPLGDCRNPTPTQANLLTQANLSAFKPITPKSRVQALKNPSRPRTAALATPSSSPETFPQDAIRGVNRTYTPLSSPAMRPTPPQFTSPSSSPTSSLSPTSSPPSEGAKLAQAQAARQGAKGRLPAALLTPNQTPVQSPNQTPIQSPTYTLPPPMELPASWSAQERGRKAAPAKSLSDLTPNPTKRIPKPTKKSAAKLADALTTESTQASSSSVFTPTSNPGPAPASVPISSPTLVPTSQPAPVSAPGPAPTSISASGPPLDSFLPLPTQTAPSAAAAPTPLPNMEALLDPKATAKKPRQPHKKTASAPLPTSKKTTPEIQDPEDSALKRKSSSELPDSKPKRTRLLDPIKKANHNEMEKKRRDEMRDEFILLRSCLPSVDNDKSPKILILKEAEAHLTKLMGLEKEREVRLQLLRKEHEALKKQLAAATARATEQGTH